MQRDLSQVKADVMQEEKFDVAKVHDEITELEKRVSRGESEVHFPGARLHLASIFKHKPSCAALCCSRTFVFEKGGLFQLFCSPI